MPIEIAFQTFLKLCSQTDGGKRSTLRNYLRPGGYDYWRPLKILAEDVATLAIPEAEVEGRVNGMCSKTDQRRYNSNALIRLSQWATPRRPQLLARPPRKVVPMGSGSIAIRVEAELCFQQRRDRNLMSIWATTGTSLEDEIASAGLLFLSDNLREGAFESHRVLLFNTVRNRIYDESTILESAPTLLDQQTTLIERIWTELNTDQPPGQDTTERPAAFPGRLPRRPPLGP